LPDRSKRAKRVEVPPPHTALGLPANPNADNQSKGMKEATRKLGLALEVVPATAVRDFDPAFEKMRENKVDALIIAQDILFNGETERLAALAIKHLIPTIYPQPEFAAHGGLISYGAKRGEAWRQSGIYVGRILKGEKPSELPVVQPTVLELAINLKTAKALGVIIPQSLLMSADEVIE
jgi:putative ABC transport system substrate-binding protein